MVLYAGLLFYLSSLPHPRVPRFAFSDKLLHLVFYAGFGLTVVWASDAASRLWPSFRTVGLAGLTAFLYGVTDEIHQRFVRGRTPDLADLVFDLLGGLAGGGIYLALGFIRRSRRKGKAPGDDPAAAPL